MLRDLDKTPVVACPNCGRDVVWNETSSSKPFCSKRCRMIDLGEWMSESHRIPGDPATDEDSPGREE